MKRVLFVICNMELGGTRSSLINLLKRLSERNDLIIDLMVLSHRGGLLKSIPNTVHLLSKNFLAESVFTPFKNQQWINKTVHIIFAFAKKLFGYSVASSFVYKSVAKQCNTECPQYDSVIGFQEGISNDAAIMVKAKNHLSWVHSNLDVWYNRDEFIDSTYRLSDAIVFVADATRHLFCVEFPSFSEKCIVIKNTINVEILLEKSKERNEKLEKDGRIVFVSIGRICKEKAFDRIISVSSRLRKTGIDNFCWYIIGSGPLERELKELADKERLSEYVIFVGWKENPYCYMIQSDCTVVTSISESQPMVILESLVLGIPVLSTNFTSATESVERNDGFVICDNSEEGLFSYVKLLCTDSSVLARMKKATMSFVYNSQREFDKVIELL